MAIIIIKEFRNQSIDAMAIWPFILIRKRCISDVVLINHEKIHIAQQKELLILPFYIWYILEFFFLFIKFKNREEAYRNISFEKEAYEQASNLSYLPNRKMWSFLKYYI